MATATELYQKLLQGAAPLVDNFNNAIAQAEQTGANIKTGLQNAQTGALSAIASGAQARGLDFKGMPAQELPRFFGTATGPALAQVDLFGKQLAGQFRNSLGGLQGGLNTQAVMQAANESRPVVTRVVNTGGYSGGGSSGGSSGGDGSGDGSGSGQMPDEVTLRQDLLKRIEAKAAAGDTKAAGMAFLLRGDNFWQNGQKYPDGRDPMDIYTNENYNIGQYLQ